MLRRKLFALCKSSKAMTSAFYHSALQISTHFQRGLGGAFFATPSNTPIINRLGHETLHLPSMQGIFHPNDFNKFYFSF